ncbi:MAG: hypothetical protein A3A33_00830 [Candidatus Yanofskybacteria bacterium RIFCSPLOWO2_01_FULL_49_25]|uniref:Uncharacterized protein n=1 Tax=Candidatus Yanofskybacteria bacterium RIFCSPLOWO2_01_FULL_49_25 TaxID=1802701 RepID=A0A1F8GXV2_9BACT|nr:MAG: hypothetical protein A3A33_00830 [Candidatus Yanofskybacteria bacterium RIFCSPLOWO2_01_FULL_49_25]
MIQWMKQWVAKPRGGANPIKYILSSDRRLKLASLKLESLVIADQHAAVNTFSNFALRMKSARQYILLNGSNPFLRVRAERS